MIHIRGCWDTQRLALQAETHRKLRMELEEEEISRAHTAEHNERIRQRRYEPYYIR